MSNSSRRRTSPQPVEPAKSMFAKAEREIAQGYLEVEITGLTVRRLVAAYTVLIRHAWTHTLGSLRSLLFPTPAH